MKLSKIVILVVLLAVLSMPFNTVHADIAPPPAPLLTGLEPFQSQNTQVQMAYERVEMELQEAKETDEETGNGRDPSKVAVKTTFVMHNRGKAPESMQVIFPMESLSTCLDFRWHSYDVSYAAYAIDEDSFAVSVDGTPVATSVVTTPHPYKDKTASTCQNASMSWIAFDVAFLLDTDVLITVNYDMKINRADAMQIVDYVLETGAGWHGPISRAYIVFKLPYVTTPENILENTTPGYQFLYNEIFWSYQDLEPTSKDNIHISFVSPYAWSSILSLRRQIKENPASPDAWMKLADVYNYIAHFHGNNIRNVYYAKKVPATYEQGIAANPQNGDLYGNYANYRINDLGPVETPSPNETRLILSLISKAIILGRGDGPAYWAFDRLQGSVKNLTFTWPPTLPPTPTSLVSDTPTVTPLPSATPRPTRTPQVVEVTVVQTVIVTAIPSISAAIRTPPPTQGMTPTPEVLPVKSDTPNFNWLIWSFLLAIGFVGGIFTVKRKWI